MYIIISAVELEHKHNILIKIVLSVAALPEST